MDVDNAPRVNVNNRLEFTRKVKPAHYSLLEVFALVIKNIFSLSSVNELQFAAFGGG